jgi:hypothetical protein
MNVCSIEIPTLVLLLLLSLDFDNAKTNEALLSLQQPPHIQSRSYEIDLVA